MIDNLKQYWFLIVALVSMSVAWGESYNKINNLEDAVKSNAQTQSEVSDMKAKAAAVDERTKNMQETQNAIQQTQKQQQRLLEQILINMPKAK